MLKYTKRRLMRRRFFIVIVFALVLVVSAVALFSFGRNLPFQPTRELVATPSWMGLDYDDVRVPTNDGESLAGWFVPATEGRESPASGLTLLFFHGNAGNMSHRVRSIDLFHDLGLNVFIIDYRGYGESTGKPSVEGTRKDADAAWRWLTETKGIPPGDIVIFGRSLGGGVAASLAEHVPAKAVILESTFTSLYDVGKDLLPWVPVSWFLPVDYRNEDIVATLRLPLLVVHSPDDDFISFRFGQTLFERHPGPKRFLMIKGSHNTGFLEDRQTYIAGLTSFFTELRALAQ